MIPKQVLYMVKVAHKSEYIYYRNGGPGGGCNSRTFGDRVHFNVGLCLGGIGIEGSRYLLAVDLHEYLVFNYESLNSFGFQKNDIPIGSGLLIMKKLLPVIKENIVSKLIIPTVVWKDAKKQFVDSNASAIKGLDAGIDRTFKRELIDTHNFVAPKLQFCDVDWK